MVSTMVWPARFSSCTNTHKLWRSSTSTPAVGSSSTMTGGRCTSACATITRRFMPPDSARILLCALSARPSEQQLVDPVIVARQAEVAGLKAQRLAHRQEGIEHQLLRHYAQRLARGAEIADHVVAHDADAAAVRPRQAGHRGNQRGLAGAVGAEQGEEFAGATVKLTWSSACSWP